jgi:hypothetical protein
VTRYRIAWNSAGMLRQTSTFASSRLAVWRVIGGIRLSCIIEVSTLKTSVPEEQVEARDIRYSCISVHHGSRFCSSYLMCLTWRIHDPNSKKLSSTLADRSFRKSIKLPISSHIGGTNVRNHKEKFSAFSLSSNLLTLLAGCFATLGLSGCLVAGYSSGGGWFIWPGSLGLIVIVLLIVFLLRRR